MTQLILKKRGLLVAVAIMAMVAPGAVYARNSEAEEANETEVSQTETTSGDSTTSSTTQQSDDATETETEDTTHDSIQDKVEAAKEKASERVVAAKEHLASAKLKRCEAHEKAITNIMARIGNRGQKQLDLFTTIAERVEAFYNEKGYTLDNYDTLVSNVAAKKAAAQTAVSAIQNADTTFACDGDNPHGVVDGFKASLKQEISALKEYRTSVKNLIVGVKSAHSTETSDTTDQGENQ